MEKELLKENTSIVLFEKKIPKLRSGQQELYNLFCKSIKEKYIIKKQEIFEIYKNQVAVGTSYVARQGNDGNTIYVDAEWSEWEWGRNFNQWFTHSLGALLKKGYLKIVPAIDLS